MARLSILDVGHGNCAVLEDRAGVLVIDAPLRETLLEFLAAHDVKIIDVVLISHADDDHVGGLVNLLACGHFQIKSVHLNPDAIRRTVAWRRLLTALAVAHKTGATRVIATLNTEIPGEIVQGRVRVTILAPTPAMVLAGPGGQLNGRTLSANTLSAVVRVAYGDQLYALLTGDLDATGLGFLLDEPIERLRTRLLVFPHHGGHAGTNDLFQFARSLCEAVRPQTVIFSIGRGTHETPQPEVVAGVLAAISGVHIACTQLSSRCADSVPDPEPDHLTDEPAQGRLQNACCAGTVVIELRDGQYRPTLDTHRRFVEAHAPTALCRSGMP